VQFYGVISTFFKSSSSLILEYDLPVHKSMLTRLQVQIALHQNHMLEIVVIRVFLIFQLQSF